MTGVPGGDVTLHAAITETLAQHLMHGPEPRDGLAWCSCAAWNAPATDRRSPGEHLAHQADRVLAVLADRLPHTPPDQLADLVGGTVLPDVTDDGKPALYVESQTWPVPDSLPAAPEPVYDPPADPENRRDSRTHPCGCQTYFDLERWRSRTTTACSEHIDDVRSTQPTQYVLPAAPEPRQDDPDPLADPEYVAWLKAGRPPHPLPVAPTEEPTP